MRSGYFSAVLLGIAITVVCAFVLYQPGGDRQVLVQRASVEPFN